MPACSAATVPCERTQKPVADDAVSQELARRSLRSYLRDASLFDNRRVLLPLGIISSLDAVRIHASELLPVAVSHCDLPMSMSASLVFPEGEFATLLATFHFRNIP